MPPNQPDVDLRPFGEVAQLSNTTPVAALLPSKVMLWGALFVSVHLCFS